MFLFSLGALALVAASIAIILPALRGLRRINHDHRDQQNIRIARQRLGEIDLAVNSADAQDDAVDAAVENEATRAEIQSALLDDLSGDWSSELSDDLRDGSRNPPSKTPGKMTTWLILALIPLASGTLYLLLGEPTTLSATRPTIAIAQQNPSADKAPSVEGLLQQLEAKLTANPGNAQGWALAGTTYMRLGRFKKAERAYQTLHQLIGDEPHVLTAWADAARMANDGVFSAQIRARILRALEINPNYDNALWVAALEAESRKEYAQAAAYLERLMSLVAGIQGDAETNAQAFLVRMQTLAQSATAGRATVTEDDSVANRQPSAVRGLSIRVRLDAKLAGKMRADDWVYVFAKAVNGKDINGQAINKRQTPLAVSRQRASELPMSIRLDDSMAMVEGMKISNFAEVSITARLSRSGQPLAGPGDLESATLITRTDNPSLLELVINRVVGDAD